MKTPKASDTTMGCKNAACIDRSIIIGINPTIVVTEVNRMGLNLATPASTMASLADIPLSLSLLQ